LFYTNSIIESKALFKHTIDVSILLFPSPNPAIVPPAFIATYNANVTINVAMYISGNSLDPISCISISIVGSWTIASGFSSRNASLNSLIENIPISAKMNGIYTTYIALMLVLISIFSLRELREAFMGLKPEAIVQLPTILMLMQLIGSRLFPEIYLATMLIVLGLYVAINAGGTIAGLGLGNRRILTSMVCLNSALLSIMLFV